MTYFCFIHIFFKMNVIIYHYLSIYYSFFFYNLFTNKLNPNDLFISLPYQNSHVNHCFIELKLACSANCHIQTMALLMSTQSDPYKFAPNSLVNPNAPIQWSSNTA